ncbi:hypothetical protein VTO42DRAFT_2923 [Malbranchea cinnamomea]
MELHNLTMRVAFEGCGHGKLNDIYASIAEAAQQKGWDSVDLVVIGGDFQAVRNANDMSCMAVPSKYKRIGDFHEYYSGARVAPYLTVFIGGNHEASNYLSELYYGGWVAPNVYYLGAAGVIRCGPLRIAGLSGIWKGYSYRKPHFERLPYSDEDIRSIYHVRELDVRKLLQIRTQVDLGLSHDWPRTAVYSGDYEALLRKKGHFAQDIFERKLGSVAAQLVLDRLRPSVWFSAHLHCKYVASIRHKDPNTEAAAAPLQDDLAPVKHGNDKRAPTSAAEPEPAPNRPVSVDREKISAWQQFYKVAVQQEKEASERYLAERAQYRKLVESGEASDVSDVTYNLTWKKVDVGNDGLERQITSVTKSSDEPTPVKNADEIELDLDSTSEAGEGNSAETTEKPRVVTNPNEPELGPDSAPEASQEKVAGKLGQSPVAMNPDEIEIEPGSASDSEDNTPRYTPEPALLPESTTAEKSKHPDPVPSELDPQASEFLADFESQQNLPTDISNKVTHFLALDKCENDRHFLQLMDLPIISKPGFEAHPEAKRPFQLEYDKEWLAITRVFATELVVGDRNAPVPVDKGEAQYRQEILAAEKWVEENIVRKGKMTIPHNFTKTAPVYDPNVPVWTTDQPPEYSNPQTEQFCQLLGIENRFHMSYAQRQAQHEAIQQLNSLRAASNRGAHGNFSRRGRGDHRRGRGHGPRGGSRHRW